MGTICYKKFQMKFEIIFLLKPFSSQFNSSYVLCTILQRDALDVMFLSLQNTKNPRIYIRIEGFVFYGSLQRTWQSPKKFRDCSVALYIQWRASSDYSFTGSLLTYWITSQNIYRTLKKWNFSFLSSEKFDLYKFRCNITSWTLCMQSNKEHMSLSLTALGLECINGSLTLIVLMWRIGWAHNNASK